MTASNCVRTSMKVETKSSLCTHSHKGAFLRHHKCLYLAGFFFLSTSFQKIWPQQLVTILDTSMQIPVQIDAFFLPTITPISRRSKGRRMLSQNQLLSSASETSFLRKNPSFVFSLYSTSSDSNSNSNNDEDLSLLSSSSKIQSSATDAASDFTNVAKKGTTSQVLQSAAINAASNLSNLTQKITSSDVQSAVTNAASNLSELTQKGSSEVQSAAMNVATNLSKLNQKGSSEIKSAAMNVATNLSNLTEKVTPSDVQSAAVNVATNLSKLTKKGTSDVQSAAMNAASNLSELTQKVRSSNVQSAAMNAATNLSNLTQKGVSNIKAVANMTSTQVTNFAEIGVSNMKNVANATTTQILIQSENISNNSIVQWIDAQARNGTSTVNAQASKMVLKFTGKDEYKFGDVTKEVIRRLAEGEYNMGDITVLLKLLLTVGVSIGPLAKALPIAVLLDALNVSLEKQVGGKIIETLATSLDARFIAAFTADDKFQLGDMAKRSLLGAILGFTGKATYEQGDIERAVSERKRDGNTNKDNNDKTTETRSIDIDNNDHPQRTVEMTADGVVVLENQKNRIDATVQHDKIDESGMASSKIINNTDNSNNPITPITKSTTTKIFELSVDPEFEEWDRMFLQSHPDNIDVIFAETLDQSNNRKDEIEITPQALDMKIASEFEEWDSKFVKSMLKNSN